MASFCFCDDDTENPSDPIKESDRFCLSAVRQLRCRRRSVCTDNVTSAVVDGESLSHHAVKGHRKINAGKINMFVVYFSSTCLDVALHRFIHHYERTVRKQLGHFEFMCLFFPFRALRCAHMTKIPPKKKTKKKT